jgi:hypothetical protein
MLFSPYVAVMVRRGGITGLATWLRAEPSAVRIAITVYLLSTWTIVYN